MYRIYAAGALMAALFLTPAAAQNKAAPALQTDLSKTYSTNYGSAISTYLQAAFPAFMEMSDWRAPVLVGYDSDEDVIAIVIFGSRTTIDSAKESVDEFRAKVLAGVLEFTKEMYGFDLTENHLQVVYINKKTNQALLKFQNGNYTL